MNFFFLEGGGWGEGGRVRSLLRICCMRCLLLEYIFDPRPDSRAPSTAGPVMTIGYQ